MIEYYKLVGQPSSGSDLGLTSSNVRESPDVSTAVSIPLILQTQFINKKITLEIIRLIIKRRYIDVKVVLQKGDHQFELADISTFWGADEKSAHIVELYYPIYIIGETDLSGNFVFGVEYLWLNDPTKLSESWLDGELQGRILLED
ncbi:MAG: hypothetical protein ABIM44_05735 [candidate division WOR-3 bacterium]